MTDEPRPTAESLQAPLEAILMVAEEPVAAQLLAQLLEVPPATVTETCEAMAAAYEAEGRGFQLAEVAGGWRFQSHPEHAAYVERFVLEGQSSRLSAAALETLAIVAYKQPISRAQVAAIRGVNVDGVVRTLQQRGYIEEIARDPGPGQAVLYGTTRSFLEKLGLASLDDLPPLAQFVPGADVVEQLEQGLRPEPGDEPGVGSAGDDDAGPVLDATPEVDVRGAAEIESDEAVEVDEPTGPGDDGGS